jgi:hypothetical protein
MAERNNTYVELNQAPSGKAWTGTKDGQYYWVFQSRDEQYQANGTLYWLLVYNDEEKYNRKIAGERLDADLMASIKEKTSSRDGSTWLGGMVFDNPNKKAFFVNLQFNEAKSEDKNFDALLSIKETEFREKGESTAPAASTPDFA